MVTTALSCGGMPAAARGLRQFALAAALVGVGTAAQADDRRLLDGLVRCDAAAAGIAVLNVELDARIPIAVVDDEDRPASYSESHVRIRLAPEGPDLTIGRSSGRFLAIGANGQIVSYGLCTPGIKT